MSRELFVDTGAWLAILDPRDKYHQVAVAFYQEALARYSRLLLTNLVAAETYINVLRNAGHHKALSFLDIIEQSSSVRCIWSDQKLEAQARDILRRYNDQDFSYTDAVSFALMEQQNLTEAFAFDRHFAVVGFVQLPTGQ
ncbi:MAG: PIN domain-containing protein [Chloroflexota bacterium]|nr:PIN domain-containing protein [Chloroflexota bacterium]